MPGGVVDGLVGPLVRVRLTTVLALLRGLEVEHRGLAVGSVGGCHGGSPFSSEVVPKPVGWKGAKLGNPVPLIHKFTTVHQLVYRGAADSWLDNPLGGYGGRWPPPCGKNNSGHA